jgi:hypothetical protein
MMMTMFVMMSWLVMLELIEYLHDDHMLLNEHAFDDIGMIMMMMSMTMMVTMVMMMSLWYCLEVQL